MILRILFGRVHCFSTPSVRQFASVATIPRESPELSYTNFESRNVAPKDPPIVVLHGMFGSKKNWESLGKALTSSGRRVITVDARNHGDSPHVEEMDYLSMSRDLETLLYKLNVHRAILLGHSMGGKTVMCLAVNRPHMVEKLIVVDVAPDTKRTALVTAFPQYIAAMKNVQFGPEWGVETLHEARRTADEQLRHVFSDPLVRMFMVSNVRETDDGFGWRINLESIGNNLDALVGFPTLEGQYKGDTLFIGGSNSHHLGPSAMPTIVPLFPRATLSVIPGAGHWVHADKPHDFINRVRVFLDDLNT